MARWIAVRGLWEHAGVVGLEPAGEVGISEGWGAVHGAAAVAGPDGVPAHEASPVGVASAASHAAAL
jgi:hypothetical protein